MWLMGNESILVVVGTGRITISMAELIAYVATLL